MKNTYDNFIKLVQEIKTTGTKFKISIEWCVERDMTTPSTGQIKYWGRLFKKEHAQYGFKVLPLGTSSHYIYVKE